MILIAAIGSLAVGYGITVYFLRLTTSARSTDWRKAAVFFLAMLVGMLFREIYSMLTDSGKLNWTRPAIAAVVSPMVFGVVYSQVGGDEINVMTLILSFQNGFFWNSVLEGLIP